MNDPVAFIYEHDWTEKIGVPYSLYDDRCREKGCPMAAADGALCPTHKARHKLRHGTLAQRIQWTCEVTVLRIKHLIWDIKCAYHERDTRCPVCGHGHDDA